MVNQFNEDVLKLSLKLRRSNLSRNTNLTSETDVYGVIYPLSEVFINRLLHEDKTVFVKYLTYEKTKLTEKNKILFYRTKSDKKIIGEGIISSIEFLLPNELYDIYKDKIMLTKKELDEYVGSRKSKKMLVLNLKNIKSYDKPIPSVYKITMAGKYISAKEYLRIIE